MTKLLRFELVKQFFVGKVIMFSVKCSFAKDILSIKSKCSSLGSGEFL